MHKAELIVRDTLEAEVAHVTPVHDEPPDPRLTFNYN
jgi:hypothetical protein